VSATPGPDEKVCPFCAEVIRAAAVKCRYCHSDLPVEAEDEPVALAKFPAAGTAHDIRETPVEPDPAPVEVATPAPPPAPDAWTLTNTAKVLLIASVVLALAIGGLFWSARPDDLRTASNGQVTSDSYRSAAMSAAAANLKTVLSYSYKTLDADKKAARAVITASYAKEYLAAMAKTGPKAVDKKLTQATTVQATSLISIKKGSAKLLVFANRITTAEGSQQQVLNQDRLLVEMTRDGGDWVVSKLSPF